jgi:hypothetical protein
VALRGAADSSAVNQLLGLGGHGRQGCESEGSDADPAVIAPAANMKQILALPYSGERVSLAVHRVGGTLLLGAPPAAADLGGTSWADAVRAGAAPSREALAHGGGDHAANAGARSGAGTEGGRGAGGAEESLAAAGEGEGEGEEGTGGERGAGALLDVRQLQERVYRRLVGAALAGGTAQQPGEHFASVDGGNARGGVGAGRRRRGKPRGGTREAAGAPHGGRAEGPGPGEQQHGADAVPGQALQVPEGRCAGGAAAAWGRRLADSESSEEEDGAGDVGWQAGAPAPFQRMCRWNLGGMQMLLGSDLMVFGAPQHPCVSLYLRDPERMTSSAAFLDLYLDNVMASVPEMLICWHKAGAVQGYLLKRTDDIPAMTSFAFSPERIKASGTHVLEWLRRECRREGSTYWLHRGAGADDLALYAAPEDTALPPHVALPVAMFCFRAAGRLAGTTRPEQRARRRELLRRGCRMLDEGKHWLLAASAHEAIAETLVAVGPPAPGAALGQVESYHAAESADATFVLPASDKKGDTEAAVSHLATALGLVEAHSGGARPRPGEPFAGGELWARARRKALECWAFLVRVHLAKRNFPAAHAALSNALRCALPPTCAPLPPPPAPWLEVAALRSLLGDLLMRAAADLGAIADPPDCAFPPGPAGEGGGGGAGDGGGGGGNGSKWFDESHMPRLGGRFSRGGRWSGEADGSSEADAWGLGALSRMSARETVLRAAEQYHAARFRPAPPSAISRPAPRAPRAVRLRRPPERGLGEGCTCWTRRRRATRRWRAGRGSRRCSRCSRCPVCRASSAAAPHPAAVARHRSRLGCGGRWAQRALARRRRKRLSRRRGGLGTR